MDWDLILRFQQAGARFKRVSRFLAAFRAHAEQKTSARMADLGTPEINRLRDRSHRRAVAAREGLPKVAPYLLKAVPFDESIDVFELAATRVGFEVRNFGLDEFKSVQNRSCPS